MAAMIDADRLMDELAKQVTALHGDTLRATGFESLLSSAACLAVARVREAVAAAIVASRTSTDTNP
jgi:hypothetical protein